jgi:GntR family transcriptional regulator / MocR family aminotransferase
MSPLENIWSFFSFALHPRGSATEVDGPTVRLKPMVVSSQAPLLDKMKEPLLLARRITGTATPLTISLNRAATTPLHCQLYQQFREAIVSGREAAGMPLPSSRALAVDLGVSRNTVLNAFDQLLAEGYVTGRRGSGTFVTDGLPDNLLWVRSTREKAAHRVRLGRTLSRRGRQLAALGVFFPPVAPIPFRHGLPAIDEFPEKLWARLASKRWRRPPRECLGYGDAAGYGPLRKAIAAYLGSARAVHCEAEQVIIVSGSQQAIYLMAQVLIDPQEEVWVEDPGYLGTRAALLSAGAHLVPVPVDGEGLIVSRGIEQSRKARLVYATPSNQYPTSATMSLSRRLELLEWARRSGAWIVEDDYDSEYRYASRPLASLQGLDQCGRVIYVGTFSKLLAPALRLGYIVAPPALVGAFTAASALISRHPPSMEQVVLADFIAEGHLRRHVRRMRTLYQQRRDQFVEVARRELAGMLEVHPPDAGTHLIGWLPQGWNDRAVAKAAGREGVQTKPFSNYCLRRRRRGGLILGYGAYAKKEMLAGVQKLATALRRFERV